jgi:hypothetical protein
MADDHRHRQPAQASPPPPRARHSLSGPKRPSLGLEALASADAGRLRRIDRTNSANAIGERDAATDTPNAF